MESLEINGEVSEQGLTSPSTHYRSFQRQVFPVHLGTGTDKINGGESRGQLANPVSRGKWPLKWCVGVAPIYQSEWPGTDKPSFELSHLISLFEGTTDVNIRSRQSRQLTTINCYLHLRLFTA